MQVVKSCKLQDGSELDTRYSVYLSQTEMSVLTDLFGMVFGPSEFPRGQFDSRILKAELKEHEQLVAVRMFNSLFRSV